MILTFVFVNRNTVTVAVNIKKTCVNINKGRGYVVVYRSKKRQVYCEYDVDIRCPQNITENISLSYFPISNVLVGPVRSVLRSPTTRPVHRLTP